MSEKKSATTKNSLTVPLILSLCMNLVLIVAIVVMAIPIVRSSTNVTTGSSTVSETASVSTETVESEETDTADQETSYFETDDGERVEVVAADDVYINTATYICAGDESEWNFTYDEDTNLTSVEVEVDGESNTYQLDFYVTTDEDNTRLVVQLVDEDGNAVSLCYLSNLVDEDENTLGMVMEMVNNADEKILLCTPDYWEVYQAQKSESEDSTAEDSTAVEETETPAAE